MKRTTLPSRDPATLTLDRSRDTPRRMVIMAWLLLASLASAAMAASVAAQAAAPQDLFVLESTGQQGVHEPLAWDAAEEFAIRVAPLVIAANPKSLVISLPGHPALEAVRTRFDVYESDWKSWFGTLRYPGGDADAGVIYLGYHGDRLTGDISFGGDRYRILGGPEVGQRLARLSNELTPPSCAHDAWARVRPVASIDRDDYGADSSGVLASAVPIDTWIDVLAVYPQAFFAESATAERGLHDSIEDSIAKANAAFANSNIGVAYRLRAHVPVISPSSQPTNGLFDSLDWLTGRPDLSPPVPRAAEAAALRDAFGADLVALFIPSDWRANEYCGVANLPLLGNNFRRGAANVSEAIGDRYFSVSRDGCGALDFTLAHEFGHNFGLLHDNWPTDPLYIYPNGRGYLFQANGAWQATIMGCACGQAPLPTCGSDILSGRCNRLAYFSDPAITIGGVPIGDATHQEAAAIRAAAAGIAAQRAQSANTPPAVVLSVSCSGLTCTFSGNGTSDNASIPSANYSWDFGNGAVASGRNVTYTYPSAGSYRVHLVVRDSGGQTGVAWSTASPWNPAYEGYLEVSNKCSQISGWAWDALTPNTAISVDVYRNSARAATVPANLFRQDLVNAGKGNGYHAFAYTPSSSWRDGQWHTPSVKFQGTSTHLHWSPGPEPVICNVCVLCSGVPQEALATGGTTYSVATQFSSSKSGVITALGFHRAPGETGTNMLRLWTNNGSQLASAQASCSTSGWCWAAISPVSITAGALYRVSVNTNTCQSKSYCGIGGGITNGPLTAHQGFWLAGDTFPTTGSCSNFFADVKFDM